MTIGDEDVLDGPPADTADEPAGPSGPAGPRTSFRRRRDVAAAALIAVAALVGGLLLWQNSASRATTSDPASRPLTRPEAPAKFPPSLGEAWRARSSATLQPVVAGPAVVTGDNTAAGGEVAGRDPLTGEVHWRYARDLPLCTVASSWSMAVTVFQTSGNLLPADDPRASGGCSEFTSLDPATGGRGRQTKPGEDRPQKPDGGQRNSDAELGTRLLTDGSYLTTTGSRLLTTLRSDLVRTVEFGAVPAIQNPNKQPRIGCRFTTVAVTTGKIGVIERCPEDSSDRLTVYKSLGAAENGGGNDDEKPDVVASVIVGDDARLVALSEQCRVQVPGEADAIQQCSAVVLPNPNRLVVFGEKGAQLASYPLGDLGDDLGKTPVGHAMEVNRVAGTVYWFTGSRTIALSLSDFSPRWTVEGALGPGTAFGGKVLVPVRDGLRVLDPADGTVIGTLPVDRGDYTGPVSMAAIGPMVLEQRGDLLVALR
jgi:hypothetical protein